MTKNRLLELARKQLANDRKKEIERKSLAQKLQASGQVQGAHAQLTEPNRLIKCDHYMRKGNDLKLSNKRDEINRQLKELKALRGQTYKHVKKILGETVEYTEKIKG